VLLFGVVFKLLGYEYYMRVSFMCNLSLVICVCVCVRARACVCGIFLMCSNVFLSFLFNVSCAYVLYSLYDLKDYKTL
jgi:hypothetical protein